MKKCPNVVIHNVPESKAEEGQERKKYNIDVMKCSENTWG